jgi:hypothetical protein
MKSRYGCQIVQSATSGPFRHSTLRDLASGQLPWRASTLGRAAGAQGKLLLHRRYAWTGYDRRYIEERFEGKGYAVLKQETAEVIIESLRPIRERFVALMADSSALDQILADGAERARAVADLKIQDVRRKVGFIVAPNSA